MCQPSLKFMIRIQISDQANSLADSVMCIKIGKGREKMLINNFPEKNFKLKKDKVFKWIS